MSKKRRTRRRTTAVVTRKRKSVRRRKSGLSGGITAGFKPALFNAAKGLLGGMAYGFIINIIDKDQKLLKNRPYIGLALSVLASTVMKQPAIGAGIAGATAQALGQSFGFLADENTIEFVPPDTLLNDNIVYDQNGFAYQELSDGTFALMDDQRAISSNPALRGGGGGAFALQDQANGNFTKVYPGYLNPGFY